MTGQTQPSCGCGRRTRVDDLTCGDERCRAQAIERDLLRTRSTVRATPVPRSFYVGEIIVELSDPSLPPASYEPPCPACESHLHSLPDCRANRAAHCRKVLMTIATDFAEGAPLAHVAGQLMGLYVVCSHGLVSFELSQQQLRECWSLPVPGGVDVPSEDDVARCFYEGIAAIDGDPHSLASLVGALYIVTCKGRTTVEAMLDYGEHWKAFEEGLASSRRSS